MTRPMCGSLALWLTLSLSAQAQDATEDEEGAADEQESAELRALRARVRALEQAMDASKQDSAELNEAAEIPLNLETITHGYASMRATSYEGTPIGGYVGDLIFTYSANLDRRLTFNSEVAFELGEAGSTLDVETVEIGMNFIPEFGLKAGRTHAPFSYWATTALHGPFRFTPINVPEIMALEDAGGGWMPIHQIGLWAQGSLPLNFWRLSYTAGVSNGRSPLVGGIAQEGDWSWGKASMGHLWLEAPSGLLIGISGYYDVVEPGTAADSALAEEGIIIPGDLQELILGTQLNWVGTRLELSGEGFFIQHALNSRAPAQNLAGYALVGVPIKRITPYVMLDTLVFDSSDPYYQLSGDFASELKSSIGARYDLGLRLAVKGQFDLIQETTYHFEADGSVTEGQTSGSGVHIQLAAGF